MPFFSSCNRAPEGSVATAGNAHTDSLKEGPGSVEYLADINASYLDWEGAKLIGEGHGGRLKLSKGRVAVENGLIVGGSILVNMNSIEATDAGMDQASKTKLLAHLKGPDFFNTEHFPDARFEITSVNPFMEPTIAEKERDTTRFTTIMPTHTITGNLTIKDSLRGITFPARVVISDTSFLAEAKFIIDRSAWGVSYGTEKSLGDKMIRPEVKLSLRIKAKR
ncbi:MAG: YceI family protein [Bacteroidota bacterium]